MNTIKDLFSKAIDRRIEEVIKVDQADESTVLEELQEYVITGSIGEHFNRVYKAIADAPAEPHEGIGIWVSGFFGSGKSSFAKIIGYTVGCRTVCGQSASDIIKEKAKRELPRREADFLNASLDLINAKIPTHAIIFDVSMDRGVRTGNERITEIMYKALLRALDYAEDFDLAELEIGLEKDGLLERFCREFEVMHGRPWQERRKIGRAINEASAVLNRMDPKTYPSADSWAKSIGQGRADITPNLLSERAFDLAAQRRPGRGLIFIIDEVGQYVSRSVDKMLDLQAVVLKQSDISEVTGKRVLHKNPDAARLLGELYDKHEGRLTMLCSLERTGRNSEIRRDDFINLYPYLPYQIDLCIDIVSQGRKVFPFSLTIDKEQVDSSGQIPLEILTADDREEIDATGEEARRASTERQDTLFWVFALNDEVHRLIEGLYRSREMISTYERIAAQGRLSPEETSCLADEKVGRDRIQRALRGRLSERIAEGAGFLRGVRKDGSALGQSISEIFEKLRDDAIPALYPKLELGNRPVKGDEVERFLTAANLNGLPPVLYEEPEGLNLVIRQSGKAAPNLNAGICREVPDYLRNEHSYGNKVTGKALDAHFQGIGYTWDRDLLRIALSVLLRGGAIEVTHQGRKYRDHNDPACMQPFINNNAFKAASFAPREAIDLRMLTDAARHFEEITGSEADIEEGALAQAFQRLAAEDREMLLPLVAQVRAARLPGAEALAEFQETIEGILEMPTDDRVKTLAGEGKSYQEARARAQRLRDALTEENLRILRSARRILDAEWPVLEERIPFEEMAGAATGLADALQSEQFYEHLDVIRQAAERIHNSYNDLYDRFHRQRFDAYTKAVDEIKGLPEWAHVAGWVKSAEDPVVLEERQRRFDTIVSPLSAKICEKPNLADDAHVCSSCRATIAQIESDTAAVDAFKASAIRALQELATPGKKILRVRASSILGSVVETLEDIEEAIGRLREHLLKLLAEDTRIVLE